MVESLSQECAREILKKYKTVAIVGLSRDPSKTSYEVAEYLKEQGYNIIPINPFTDKILGKKSYGSLLEMPAKVQKAVEIVDIFRPAEDVISIVEQAVELRKLHGVLRVVWMQLGIMNETAAEMARKAGMVVIMNRCMMKEHKQMIAKEDRAA